RGDRGGEINALGSALPSPVCLGRGIIENAKAQDDRLQGLILLELDIGVRLERQDSILDVEGRRRVPTNLEARVVVDAAIRLYRGRRSIMQADDGIQRFGNVDDVEPRILVDIRNVGPRRITKRLLNHQGRIDGRSTRSPAGTDDRWVANGTKIDPSLAV